jgi:hypothetical protein
VNDLSRYLDVIVEPTFEEFKSEPSSRRAFLVCVAIYHAIDRVAYPKSSRTLRQQWAKQSLDFKLVDVVAHHFKHVRSSDEKIPPDRQEIPISFALGFNEEGDEMELRNFSFVMRDAVKFLRQQAGAPS